MAADRRRARARIRRARLRAWAPALGIAGVLAVAALVAIPLGGWDTVELRRDVVPELAVDEPFSSALAVTTIHGARVTQEHPDGFSEAEPGEEWLVLDLTLENRIEEPITSGGLAGFRPFTIAGVLEADDGGILDTIVQRDGTFGGSINPGMAERLMYTFAVPSGQYSAGDILRVGLWDAIRQEADLYRGIRWWQPRLEAEVPVVLEVDR